MPKGIPQGLQWTKQLKVGDVCSYSDVNLWFSFQGTITEIADQNWIKVKWDDIQGPKREYRPNIIAWVDEQEKLSRDTEFAKICKAAQTWAIPLKADDVLRKAGLK